MRADDEPAFEQFVARSAERLLLSATLLVGGDWAAGEDLLQGALERTYRHRARIAEDRREAYVRRALVNGATSRWRRQRARVTEVPLLVDGAWTADVTDTCADHADQLSDRDGLARALLSLPPRQRAVLVLRYLDDLPEGEVAAALGCSVGSVRSQTYRGLARLRDNEHVAALADATPRREPTARRPRASPATPPPVTATADVLTNESGPPAPLAATTTTANRPAKAKGMRS
ncbi:SigE family RNA polymerase sigma factor [Pseudofrankia asymbiotica]|uniref:RNA polymerase subunit sigma-24 n=1 Tax=Pseudofrankia asymbiotica TaxID=1834516 RepID=A0A1V2IIP8_9ACTN|nr:SigE family RNA polymerase sigma factor [Pseudofrankia asymbiotica]ONH32799.1 RNA polymerase subunit sigma-24 [Pseudofrankia asymbiotica]